MNLYDVVLPDSFPSSNSTTNFLPSLELIQGATTRRSKDSMAGFGSSKNDADAPLCANNCGFYGSPNNRNLCSVCYAAFLKGTGEDSEEGSKNQIKVEEPNLGTRQSPSASQSPETCENNPTLKPKNRCKICRKKVGLLGFNCRCGGSFCGKHRHPEEHSCDFDHKAIGRNILAKQIIECKSDKLEFRV